MPWAAAASLAASVVGSAIAGSNAPSTSSGPNVYQPSGTGAQDSNLQNLLGANTNTLSGSGSPFATLSPQMQQVFQQLFNNPGTAGFNAAAGQAGQGYTGVGNNSLNLSNLLSTTSQPALTAGSQVLNTAMDPQNALYAQTLQKVNDQANVANAQYGLTGQQAAGNVQQADTNFNIDWQDKELQRQLQGLTGYNQTASSVGGVGAAAQDVGAAGAGSVLSGGATPYTTGQTIGTNQNTALLQQLQNLLSPVTQSQSTIQDLQNYLNTGVTASNYGQQASVSDYLAQMAGGAAGSNVGSSLGNSLSGLFNTQTSGGSSGGLLPWQQPGYGTSFGYGSSGYDPTSGL